MENKTVYISVDEEGQFTYQPTLVRMTASDQILWQSESGPFAITFQGKSPFHRADFSSYREQSISSGEVRQDVLPGAYHYAVAVATANGVQMDAGCPSIIIRPSRV